MSPRPYQLGRRQEAADLTRARIITAARELLTSSEAISSFTVDAVARRANVARMTVYYQFGSKIGLLEALFDDLAVKGQIERLRVAFSQPESLAALDGLIATFGHMWSANRLVIRRLHALAALDPDLEVAVRARYERLREGLRVIVRRLIEQHGRPAQEAFPDVVDLLFTLISFESFDSLAGPSRSLDDVVPLIRKVAHMVIGLSETERMP